MGVQESERLSELSQVLRVKPVTITLLTVDRFHKHRFKSPRQIKLVMDWELSMVLKLYDNFLKFYGKSNTLDKLWTHFDTQCTFGVKLYRF